ncbi:hypothetical protein CYMTET_26848, partial [Cymbomonas tetramitiformis]
MGNAQLTESSRNGLLWILCAFLLCFVLIDDSQLHSGGRELTNIDLKVPVTSTDPSTAQLAEGAAAPSASPVTSTDPSTAQLGEGAAAPSASAVTSTDPSTAQLGERAAAPSTSPVTSTDPSTAQLGEGAAAPSASPVTSTDPSTAQLGEGAAAPSASSVKSVDINLEVSAPGTKEGAPFQVVVSCNSLKVTGNAFSREAFSWLDPYPDMILYHTEKMIADPNVLAKEHILSQVKSSTTEVDSLHYLRHIIDRYDTALHDVTVFTSLQPFTFSPDFVDLLALHDKWDPVQPLCFGDEGMEISNVFLNMKDGPLLDHHLNGKRVYVPRNNRNFEIGDTSKGYGYPPRWANRLDHNIPGKEVEGSALRLCNSFKAEPQPEACPLCFVWNYLDLGEGHSCPFSIPVNYGPFAVSKQQIKLHSKEFYIKLRDWAELQSENAYALERLWLAIFRYDEIRNLPNSSSSLLSNETLAVAQSMLPLPNLPNIPPPPPYHPPFPKAPPPCVGKECQTWLPLIYTLAFTRSY